MSDTENQARDFLGGIKAQILENDELREAFGIGETIKEAETEFAFKFKNGDWCRLVAKGSGQKLRGLLYRNSRPDLAIIDDCENDELVENKIRRDKQSRWFYGALIPALAKKAKLRMVGTVLHFDSLLERCLKNKSWYTRRYRAHNEDFTEILWPEEWPRERLEELRATFLADGKPDLYSQEYLNEPISRGNAYFDRSWWVDKPVRRPTGKLRHYLGMDLAVSLSEKADWSVFVVVGIDNEGYMFVLDVIRERLDAEEIMEELFRLHKIYKFEMMIGERGQISHAIKPFLAKEEIKRGIFLPFPDPLPVPSKDKAIRARPLQAKVRAGTVVFNQEAEWWPDLEDEMIKFLRSSHDDQVDALAWLCIMDSVLMEGQTEAEAQLDEDLESGAVAYSSGSNDGRSRFTGY